MASDTPGKGTTDEAPPGTGHAADQPETDIGIEASGAADEQLALVLRVEVDERPGIEEALFQRLGAVHAGLLGNSKQTLDTSGGSAVFKQSKACGHADAVIGPERRILGNHPPVFYYVTYRVFAEVVLNSGVLFANHVLVGLQHYGGNILLSGSCIPDNQHVARSIALVCQRMILRPAAEPVGKRTFVSGFPGDSGYFLEDIKNSFCFHGYEWLVYASAGTSIDSRSETYFLNTLSVAMRSLTILHECNTVA